MYEEKKTDFQEEKHTLEKKKAKCESEKETLREMKNVVQKNQEKLCKDRECLEEQQTIIQKEYEKYQKDVEILKEDKVGLQVEKDRLENVEKSIQEKFDSLQIVNVRLAKNREELNEKERSIESRIEKACILEEERKKFQNEWEMLKKTQDILLKKMALLDKRESRLEDDNRQLQKELENIQCSQEDIKKNSVVLLEKERIIKDERAELETAWESLRQSQDDLKKEQDAMKQKCEEIDEKMKTVGESDRNTHGGDRGQDVLDTESPELLKEQLQNLEDELDCMTVDLEGANEKIKTLEYFITKGKALLAENTYSINQANNRIKELEENLVLSTAKLEATNEECEKLKKIQQNSRVAALEQDGLRKELEVLKKMRAGDTDYYEDVIRQLKLKLRDVQSNEASFYEPKDSSSKCTPSIDQMRKIIEFENASKFLELSDLRKRVAEQKTEISNLEAEKSQLQAQCNTLQLHVDNETLKSETMKSTANQATCARIKCEAELTKLKRELGKDRNQVQDVSSDEATKMLKNQLKEKDSLINELNRTIDTRNMQWNGIALRNKQLIEQNHSKQKLESELQVVSAELAKLRTECSDLEKFRKDSAELTRLRQEIAENKTFKHSTSTQLLTLQKENTELKASLEKLKSEVQVAPKDSYLKHLQGQENLQLPQEELQHHSSTNMSGGAIASYVIVVKEREIRDLKKKIHMQSELLKQLGKNINSGSEEHDYRRSLDNSIDKENQTPHH
uniref:Uncharacterized protein n=1 Tax=Arion vulgaris TaxID=1028688 RepID=A0A0B6ZZY0_9EUPU